MAFKLKTSKFTMKNRDIIWLNFYHQFQIVISLLHSSSSHFFTGTIAISIFFCTVGGFILIRVGGLAAIQLTSIASIYCFLGVVVIIVLNKNGDKFDKLSRDMVRGFKRRIGLKSTGVDKKYLLRSLKSCQRLSVKFSDYGKFCGGTMIVCLHICINATLTLLLAFR